MSSPGFIQIMDFTTPDIDAVLAVTEEWKKATEGRRTARHEIVTRDRNNADRYRIIVFFDSYESAMENSNLPETQQFAEKQAEVLSGLSFVDLEVVRDADL
jgi:hypothetical protein